MTREEYQEFSLRYKGCGACFPLFEKLTRFEKLWFTAIQKDVASLEKENAELREQCSILADCNTCYSPCKTENTKAKEIIKNLCGMVRELNKPNVQLTNVDYSLSEAEHFLNNEVEK